MEKVYAWRLAKAKYRESAFDGVGSALGGGRWNSVGTPVVYCATTLALAVLEVRVHIPLANFQPRARYAGLEILIDSTLPVSKLSRNFPAVGGSLRRRAPKAPPLADSVTNG